MSLKQILKQPFVIAVAVVVLAGSFPSVLNTAYAAPRPCHKDSTYRLFSVIKLSTQGKLKIYRKPSKVEDRYRFCAMVVANKNYRTDGIKSAIDLKVGTRSKYNPTSYKWYYRDYGRYHRYAGPLFVTPGKGRCAIFYGAIKARANYVFPVTTKSHAMYGKYCNP